jgi:hypothetical protein
MTKVREIEAFGKEFTHAKDWIYTLLRTTGKENHSHDVEFLKFVKFIK